MKRYLLIVFLFLPGFIQAQVIIRGTVLDEERKPVQDLNITVQEQSKSLTLGFVMTDDDGKYRLEYKGRSDSIVITISGFNVRKQSRTIKAHNQEVDFTVEKESIVLNEVKINPPRIRQTGDTLNYLVDVFSDANDRTIGDVLKKMPGIKVQDNGAIFYQNRPINKFYIENADLLQGRYGIATNNIEAKDVATVQVMENHQPVKALKGKEFSEDAAINLKLKDSAKGTIIANAQVGVGAAPLLWNNELTGMYIAKKMQNITTYKGNNSGDDVTAELNSFYSGDASQMADKDLLNVQSPASPSIREKRYLDNRANIFSFNNLWTLKNDYQLTANVSYLNDLQQKSSYAYTEYYLPGDSLLRIDELLNSRLREERIKADIQLNANKDKFYFNNLLKLDGIWDRERGDAISEDSVSQYLKKPAYGISNTFNMVKTGEKYTWNFYSFNGYNTSSQTLLVQPVLYDQLYDPVSVPSAMVQDIEQGNFASYNKVSLGLGKGSFKQSYALGFRADIRNLKSGLGTEQTYNIADSLRNDIQQNKFEWTFTPNYTYAKGRKLNISLSLPLSYTVLETENKIQSEKTYKAYLYFNPGLFVHYKLSGYWTSFLNYKHSNSLGDINQVYTGYIMSSYRNLLRNDGSLFKQKSHKASLSLNYRNPLTTLFAMADISYFNNKANLLYDYSYQGILKVQSTIAMPNTTQGINASVHASKDIESLHSTIFLGGNYTISSSSQINQGELIDYNNRSFSVSPRILTKIGSAASIQYEFNYAQSMSRIENEDKCLEPIRTIVQNVRLNLFPLKGLTINLKYEHFYNNAIRSGSRSMTFGDISVKYKWRKMELMCDYTNIFNSKQFVSASYNDVSRYYSSYGLRPAEILFKVRFKLK
ncbi:hypothetical protein D0T84_12985 [Dysgonomonas sp. 521]|uniref:carboxypeptidase-like regulatory domain-containing protein n=1 Tax=Dysgonomonas sp. 521 TaxID=2302932 RepID=UPI0013D3C7D7|nr:carboxypeptidase-like regulatory domain-containing protein [Dysgonomonas sp. 521]NDV95818.1 hypothetical protein [Dysgonomonas sp. 521]